MGRGAAGAAAAGAAWKRSGDRDDRPRRDDRDSSRAQREDREPREIPPGLHPKENEPPTPTDVDLTLLSRGVKAELRGLSVEQAEIVGAHLAAAAELIDTDPALAYSHAEAARRRASRLPVAREAAGTTAYAAGEYAAALNEFRALRRMTGSDEFLAVMADCERALERPQAALKLVKQGLDASPPAAARVELKLVEAGARDALGQRDEAIRLLHQEIELLGARGPKAARARLRYYFAALLAESGDTGAAEQWFATAIRLDPDDETGAADALAELQGIRIEFDDTEDEIDDPEDEIDDSDDSEESEGESVDSEEPEGESVDSEGESGELEGETEDSEEPDQLDDRDDRDDAAQRNDSAHAAQPEAGNGAAHSDEFVEESS